MNLNAEPIADQTVYFYFFKITECYHWRIQGGATGTPPPQQDPFLPFSHTFLPKSVCVRGWRTPQWVGAPQREILDLPLVTIKRYCNTLSFVYHCYVWKELF